MIEIIRVVRHPAEVIDGDVTLAANLFVEIEIDGYSWSEGGLPADWDDGDILAYFEAKEADILRQAMMVQPVEESAEVPEYVDYTAASLPQSTHIAVLISVDAANNKADVARVLYGETYLVANCFVTQSAVDLYMAGKIKLYNPAYPPADPINADSFVVMEYITETPLSVEINLPTLTDKFLLASSSTGGTPVYYQLGDINDLDLQLASVTGRTYAADRSGDALTAQTESAIASREGLLGYNMATTDILIIALLLITLVTLVGHKLRRRLGRLNE